MKPQIKQFTLIYIIIVILIGNLNAIVDAFLHPSISYFDEEHLIVGGITALAVSILFSFIIIYLNQVKRALTKQQELEIRLTKSEQQQNIAHSSSLAAIGKLSSSIVHEMRNPLTSIKMNVQALSRKVGDDPTFSEIASIACQQTERLQTMLSDLLTFGASIELNYDEIQFKSLVKHLSNELQPVAQEKDITLQFEDKLEGKELFIDSKLISLALHNLVLNAIQWAAKNSIVIIEGRIDMEREGFFSITVSDCGPGINKEQLNRLFTPFFSTRPGGKGLGLAYVHKMVEYHRGFVLAQSNPEEHRTTFKMTLPLKGIKT
nr:HAMP domain-containing histidine kinase [Desulfobulbaceae bacterium]